LNRQRLIVTGAGALIEKNLTSVSVYKDYKYTGGIPSENIKQPKNSTFAK
jgi:hypothetical protein